MIALLDTNEDLNLCEQELGCPVQQLITPTTRRLRQRPDALFAIDNGAFSGFNRDMFLSLLEHNQDAKSLCLFVAVPDIVGNARRTQEAFDWWRYKLSAWPLALVAQDGIEDLPIEWNAISAIFIGGSTGWKLSKAAADVIRCAKIVHKWVHVGRVNTPGRFEYFEELGADSIDGSGLARFSWMREEIYRRMTHPTLFTEAHA
jgi:hypothetical protein